MTDLFLTTGLTNTEVAQRHRDGQGNVQAPRTARSVGDILRENVFTLFNAILTGCFLVLAALGDLRDGLFYGVVVVNAGIGIVQELRAKRVLDRAALLSKSDSRVRRAGAIVTVPADEVVLGDLLVLRPGDQIPADARLLDGVGFCVDESMLTGESEPVAKTVGAGLLSGSLVASGTGRAQVTAVGVDSYAQKFTSEMRRRSLVHSELRNATNRVLTYISWLLGPLIVVILLGRVLTYGGLDAMLVDDRWRAMLVEAVSSVVVLIPEGLVLLTSLAFAAAAVQLSGRGVVVQELAAIEVLARVDVLCLDKTGTLTSGTLDFERLQSLRGEGPFAQVETVLGAFGADEDANATAQVLSRFPRRRPPGDPAHSLQLHHEIQRAHGADRRRGELMGARRP